MNKSTKRDSIRLYYYKYPNIGDILNELLPEKLFHLQVKEERYTTAEIMGIGSVLDRLLSNGNISKNLMEMRKNLDTENTIHIWGTGLMHQYDDEQAFVRPVKIHALRGALTQKKVEEMLGKKCRCALGDPGLLAPLLLKKVPKKKWNVGIIPHYVDAENPIIAEVKQHYPNSVIVNVKDKPYKVLRQIAKCKTVLSTSLHGLIIADSFHIPNQWCVCSDKILGSGFKYKDYYSAFRVTVEPLDLRKGSFPTVEEIKNNYKIPYSEVKKKQRALIRSFPYNKWSNFLFSLKIR